MFKYQQLIKAHLDDIAKLITVEQVFFREREVQKRNWFSGAGENFTRRTR